MNPFSLLPPFSRSFPHRRGPLYLTLKIFSIFSSSLSFLSALIYCKNCANFFFDTKKSPKIKAFLLKKFFYPIVSNITLSMYLQTFDTHSSKSTFSNRSVIPACFRFSSQKSSESARNLLHSSAYFGSANLFFNLVISLDCCEVCAFFTVSKNSSRFNCEYSATVFKSSSISSFNCQGAIGRTV